MRHCRTFRPTAAIELGLVGHWIEGDSHYDGFDPVTFRRADTLDEISRALLAVRDLERVGDHGVNIAARTLYMIESDDELIY